MRGMYSLPVFLLLSLLLLAGCQTGSGVGYAPGVNKVTGTYETFSTSTVDMPSFLGPLMESNFVAAFSAKGLNPVEQNAQLKVTLRFIQEDLDADSSVDDFEGHLTPGGNVRFLARVQVEIREADSDEMIFSGSIQRIHDVDAGEFMHTGNASTAILENFRALLKSFP